MSYEAVKPQPDLGEQGTRLAPEGQVWVCAACGKTSRSLYGFDKDEKGVADTWWDESCIMNAVLCKVIK